MNPSDVYVGVDTSAYTTSVASYANGRVLFDGRKILEVAKGERGLRQSDAVFTHVKNLHVLFRSDDFLQHNGIAVAYSAAPCPVEGSYMPVFCVGQSHAAAYAAANNAPLYALTHQHGHLYAAFLGQDVPDGTYGAFHVSGGTLDCLRVGITEGIIDVITPLGGTLDITCGQMIDRIGVKAGLAFPSGAKMERMYKPDAKPLSVHVQGMTANLSGAETQAMRRLEAGEDVISVCSAVIDCVAQTLGCLLCNTAAQTGLTRFLFTGGVMKNDVIRQYLSETCAQHGLDAIHVQKQYCSDNACGLALAAQRLYQKGAMI